MQNSRTEKNTLNRLGFPQEQGSGELEQGNRTERSTPVRYFWLSPSTGHKMRRKAGKDAAEAFRMRLESKDNFAGPKRMAARPYSRRTSHDSES